MAGRTALVHADMANLNNTANQCVANSQAAARQLLNDIEGGLMPVFKGAGATRSLGLTVQINDDLTKIHQLMQQMSDQVKNTDTQHAAGDQQAESGYARIGGQMNVPTAI